MYYTKRGLLKQQFNIHLYSHFRLGSVQMKAAAVLLSFQQKLVYGCLTLSSVKTTFTTDHIQRSGGQQQLMPTDQALSQRRTLRKSCQIISCWKTRFIIILCS